MSAGSPGRPTFRPFRIFACAGFVWVVDEAHPVAALFDPDTRAFVRLVSWMEMSPGVGERRPPRFAVDDDGFWVQYCVDDALGRIGPEGLVSATYSRGAELVCAGTDGAWLQRPSSNRREISSSPDTPPRYEATSTVLHVDRTGSVNVIPVEGMVYSMRAERGMLYFFVQHEPWSRLLIDDQRAAPSGIPRYRVEWATSVMSLSLNQSPPAALTRAEHSTTALPQDTSYMQDYADQSYNDAHLRKRADGEGVRWHWGRETPRDRRMTVRAFDVDSDRLLWENDVEAGWVMRGAAENQRAWLLIRETTRTGGGTRIEVWDARSQTIELMTATYGLDISAHRWPLGQRPADHDSYVELRVSQLDGYEFSEHVSDVTATYVGDWPDGYIELSYRHDGYPGIVIRSKVTLYNLIGRKTDHLFHYVSSELFEQAGTRAYPSASLAVNGILDV